MGVVVPWPESEAGKLSYTPSYEVVVGKLRVLNWVENRGLGALEGPKQLQAITVGSSSSLLSNMGPSLSPVG